MSDAQGTMNGALAEEDGVAEFKESARAPIPSAVGNERISILNHHLSDGETGAGGGHQHSHPYLELAIANVSGSTIATAMFEAVLYDHEGNIVETIKHRETALEPGRSRGVVIHYPPYDSDRVKSYQVRIVKTSTADEEKVQLRRHDIRTTEAGEEEIIGIIKNISRVKTDAAVVATFLDFRGEIIGTVVKVLRDLEPEAIRQYRLNFRPAQGEQVETYKLEMAEVAAD